MVLYKFVMGIAAFVSTDEQSCVFGTRSKHFAPFVRVFGFIHAICLTKPTRRVLGLGFIQG